MTPEDYLARLEANEEITHIDLSNQNLTDIRLWPLLNFLNNPSNSTAAQRIMGLSLNGNRFTTINVQGLTSLEFIILSNNPLTTVTKLKLDALNQAWASKNNLRGIVNFTYELEMGMPEKLTAQILDAHFRVLITNLQDDNNRNQPMRCMLVRGTGLPNELIRMIFDFLGADQIQKVIPLAYICYVKSEIYNLKNLFPEQQDIINDFESSAEFRRIMASYGKPLGQLENEARADDRGMKTLLNQYRRFDKYTTNFKYLRDATRLEPADNPFQLALRPRKL